MKLTNVKTIVAKAITTGLLAGAFVIVSPAKAPAQVFSVGVQFGNPGHGNHSYYDRLRLEQEQREAYLRQQAWERQQAWQRREARERHQSYAFDRDDRRRDYRYDDHDRH